MDEQEQFWAGQFGTEYSARNARQSPGLPFWWGRMLERAYGGIASAIELGANIGLNLQAISRVFPDIKLTAVEINPVAFDRLSKLENVDAFRCSLFDFETPDKFDLAFTSGVLIHVNPDRLDDAYAKLYSLSRRYILLTEYYSPTPVDVHYRGHEGKLFKRDWAGDLLDRYPDLQLVDYGFFYRRDPVFPADDQNWFLLEKR